MSDLETVDERLRAVERALTDDDTDLTDLRDAAELTHEIETLAARLDDAEDRLDELDAATQALRGYVGNVRAVNESVERRADAALAKAESVEAELGGIEPQSAKADSSEVQPQSFEAEANEPRSGSAADAHPTCVCGCEHERDSSPRVEPERDTRGADRERTSDSERDDLGLLARIAEAL